MGGGRVGEVCLRGVRGGGDDMNTETTVMTYPWSSVSVCRYSLLLKNQ